MSDLNDDHLMDVKPSSFSWRLLGAHLHRSRTSPLQFLLNGLILFCVEISDGIGEMNIRLNLSKGRFRIQILGGHAVHFNHQYWFMKGLPFFAINSLNLITQD